MKEHDRSVSHARPAGDAAANVPSPCISICQMDPHSGLCIGCLRTLDEIACWGGMDETQKNAVCLELVRRQEVLF